MSMNLKTKSLVTGIDEPHLIREAMREGWLAMGFGDLEALV